MRVQRSLIIFIMKNNIFFIILIISLSAWGLESPFKAVLFETSKNNLNENDYTYALKFQLYGLSEYQKLVQLKAIDKKFSKLSHRSAHAEIDYLNLKNIIYLLDAKDKLKVFNDFNESTKKTKDILIKAFENSGAEISTTLKLVTEDEQNQVLKLDLIEKINEVSSSVSYFKINDDLLPKASLINTNQAFALLKKSKRLEQLNNSNQEFELQAKLALAQYEYDIEKNNHFLNGFEIAYDKNFDDLDKKPELSIKVSFNIPFFSSNDFLPYSEKFKLQRKMMSDRNNLVSRYVEVKNIQAHLEEEIKNYSDIIASEVKFLKQSQIRKKILSKIDLQLLQSLEKSRFEKNMKLISLRTSILEKILLLIYESNGDLTYSGLLNYVN